MPRACLLAAIGGSLCFLGFVGFGIWPLALVSLALLWQALEETLERRARSAALVGFVFGWVAYAGGFHWLWRLVDVFLGSRWVLGAFLWLADSSWFALRFALYAILYRAARRRGWGIGLAGVPPLLLVEWLYPQLFPVHLGHSLAEMNLLVQVSDLGGPLLLTAMLALVNVSVFESWRWLRGERSQPAAVWAIAGLALASACGYGALRIRAVERSSAAAPSISIGIVQGNL